MIGPEDCIAMCGLEPEQMAAICEHEHICETQAAALGSYYTSFIRRMAPSASGR